MTRIGAAAVAVGALAGTPDRARLRHRPAPGRRRQRSHAGCPGAGDGGRDVGLAQQGMNAVGALLGQLASDAGHQFGSRCRRQLGQAGKQDQPEETGLACTGGPLKRLAGTIRAPCSSRSAIAWKLRLARQSRPLITVVEPGRDGRIPATAPGVAAIEITQNCALRWTSATDLQ